MASPTFLYSIVKLHWGFTVRQLGASAAQLAYVLPPPATVVGSFMNPLARILELGEALEPRRGPAGSRAMDCALKATIAASAGLMGEVGVVVHAEPSRITAALYKTGGDYQRALREPPYLAADRLLPVQAVGQASAPGASLALAWLVDPERLSECLDASLGHGELERAAWSIYRIGSREGIASVLEARALGVGDLERLDEGSRFDSILYQPGECVEALRGAIPVTLYDTTYREALYHVPSQTGGPTGLTPPVEEAYFEVKSGCAATRPRGKPQLAVAHRAA